MSRFVAFLTLVVWLGAAGSTGYGADRPLPRSSPHPVPAVVLVAADSTSDVRGERLSEAVGQSIANHLGYAGVAGDFAVDIKTASETVAPEAALLAVERLPNRTALLAYYRVERQDTSFVARDRHRRRYFARTAGCLRLQIDWERHVLTQAGWMRMEGGTIESSGRLRGMLCEPYDRVVQRAVDEMVRQIPRVEPERRVVAARLPVSVLVAPGLMREKGLTRETIGRIAVFASEQLLRQFELELRIVSLDTLDEGITEGGRLAENAAALDEAVGRRGDTLVVVFNSMLEGGEFEEGGWREEIGLTRLGQRRVYMDLIPATDSADTVWMAVANGMTLLHEIGHAFGGIHVSDVGSIMNHRATWVNGAAFDPLNREIIGAALRGELRFDSPAAYLRYVSEAVARSGYYRSDYPGFFHQYLNWGDNPSIAENLRAAIGIGSHLLAADGVSLLTKGRDREAAALLREAIRENPLQAAPWYYLSLALRGQEAEAVRAEAQRRGYAMAAEPRGTAAAVIDIAR